jgi:NADP-dependent 3-hydroxy acid dehydrogenase YdfG
MRKRIVVTGGTKGIGRSIVLYFARKGYDLATCGRDLSLLESLRQEVNSIAPGQEILAERCDVSDPDDIKSWCQLLAARWPTIDILVNNAGTFLSGSVLHESEQNLDQQLDLNLKSAYRITRALMDCLKANESGGHIFNMCSIASKTAYASGGAYTISKFALYGFSLCLREELKSSQIKVTSVLPGATWSDSWKTSSFTPNDMIQADDIASLIYHCSQLSKQAVVEELIIRPQGGDL